MDLGAFDLCFLFVGNAGSWHVMAASRIFLSLKNFVRASYIRFFPFLKVGGMLNPSCS